MTHVIARRWDDGVSISGGTIDETAALAGMADALSRLRATEGSERERQRTRLRALSHQLARALVNAGREHHASALVLEADDAAL